MSNPKTFKVLDGWYSVDLSEAKYTDTPRRRLIIYDFSDVLVYTATYNDENEIYFILRQKLGDRIRRLEID